MCQRILSTFERCGHQDTIAHVQLCKPALDSFPSVICPLNSGETTPPVYNMCSFCPQCALNNAVIASNGHLQEHVSNTAANIVFQVPTPAKAKQIVDVGASKQSTDVPLVWKEVAAFSGGDAGGWNEPSGGWADSSADWNGNAADVAVVVTSATDDDVKESSTTEIETGFGAAEQFVDGGVKEEQSGEEQHPKEVFVDW